MEVTTASIDEFKEVIIYPRLKLVCQLLFNIPANQFTGASIDQIDKRYNCTALDLLYTICTDELQNAFLNALVLRKIEHKFPRNAWEDLLKEVIQDRNIAAIKHGLPVVESLFREAKSDATQGGPPLVLTGKKKSGKSTVAEYLRKHHGYQEDAFALPLKYACQIIFALTDDQLFVQEEKERIDPRYGCSAVDILQVMGSEVMRDAFPDVLTKLIKHEHNFVRGMHWIMLFEQRMNHSSAKLIISDCRFPNEAAAVRKYGGRIWRIQRNLDDEKNKSYSTHISETEGDKIIPDVTIDNNSTLDTLYSIVDQLLSTKPTIIAT